MSAMRVALAGAGGRMGRTLIEAILADKELELGAAFDLVRDGIDGRIVPAGDVAALAHALSEALPPLDPASGPIHRWNYDFAVSQFVEGLSLAMNAS